MAYAAGENRDSDIKVFCFFSSEKKTSCLPSERELDRGHVMAAINIAQARSRPSSVTPRAPGSVDGLLMLMESPPRIRVGKYVI
jgi:hypothetical protein